MGGEGGRAPSSMRSWITIETQKMISSMHGLVMVESIKRDEVELYFGAGARASTAATAIGSSSFSASSCECARRERP